MNRRTTVLAALLAAAAMGCASEPNRRQVQWRYLESELESFPRLQDSLTWRPMYDRMVDNGMSPKQARKNLRRAARFGPFRDDVAVLVTKHDDPHALQEALNVAHAQALDARYQDGTTLGYPHPRPQYVKPTGEDPTSATPISNPTAAPTTPAEPTAPPVEPTTPPPPPPPPEYPPSELPPEVPEVEDPLPPEPPPAEPMPSELPPEELPPVEEPLPPAEEPLPPAEEPLPPAEEPMPPAEEPPLEEPSDEPLPPMDLPSEPMPDEPMPDEPLPDEPLPDGPLPDDR